jgi:ribosome-associated toxin RatA of RatAB toxin-antitoxin module
VADRTQPNRTQSSINIPAAPQDVLAVIADLERYPEWVDALTSVEVLTTTKDDRPEQVRMVLSHKLLSDDYTVRYDFADDAVNWQLVEGKTLTAMDGSYRVQPSGTGSTVTYTLSVDVAIALPSLIKRTAEKTITDAALKGLKKQVAKVSG